MFITRETNNRDYPEDIVRHEYGHTLQLKQLGVIDYALCIALPSWQEWGTNPNYYSRPWEITADVLGGVQSRNHSMKDVYRAKASSMMMPSSVSCWSRKSRGIGI